MGDIFRRGIFYTKKIYLPEVLSPHFFILKLEKRALKNKVKTRNRNEDSGALRYTCKGFARKNFGRDKEGGFNHSCRGLYK